MRQFLRWYGAKIEQNWSLEAAKIIAPMFVIGYIILYIAHA